MREIKFDEFVFSHMGEESNKRTTNRLQQLIDMGCVETGIASFGVNGVVSGLYIEKVWGHSDEDWDSHIEWMQGLIDNKVFTMNIFFDSGNNRLIMFPHKTNMRQYYHLADYTGINKDVIKSCNAFCLEYINSNPDKKIINDPEEFS